MSMIPRLRNHIAASAAVCLAVLLPTHSHAQQRGLPVVSLTAGMHVIQAEVASTPSTRSIGLMQRTKLPSNHGMLFVFEKPQKQCFWMRNTPLLLSIAFLADDGDIVNMADMTPLSDEPHCSKEPISYALEIKQGWFTQHGLNAGSKLKGLPSIQQ
jgi:uncharacterized protein